ncbi:hypothetical protein CAC42_2405 [Sphaceloma murrayae]|uniref:Uncharacterized protein n=1 Tax=Sphaceloma murrayae TaxID=2082308 RepID=A0A2K1QVZ6_9PEZI|nr:hypothetical protein CAC42_2405 [Sphaceloma murrayae]
MNRIYGQHTCDQCGRPSQFGWIYQCTQDVEHNAQVSADDHLFMSLAPRDWNDKIEMAALGISHSVMSQYDAGLYTPAQIKKIKDQKRHLHRVLVGEVNRENAGRYASPPTIPLRGGSRTRDSSPIAHYGGDLSSAAAHSPLHGKPATATRNFSKPDIDQTCRFKCCHRCRPFYEDRMYTSIEAAFDDKIPQISAEEATKLHVLDARVLKKISHNPLRTAEVTSSNTDSHDFALESPRDLSSEYSSVSLSSSGSWSSLGKPCRDPGHILSQSSSSSSPVTSPTASTLTSPRTTLSSHSLPITPLSSYEWPGTPLSPSRWDRSKLHGARFIQTGIVPCRDDERQTTPGASPNHSLDGKFRSNPVIEHESSEGEEVEVDGGVALTEEAVDRRLPNVATTPDMGRLRPTPSLAVASGSLVVGEEVNGRVIHARGHMRTETQT